jgi:phage tail tape-measure protein
MKINEIVTEGSIGKAVGATLGGSLSGLGGALAGSAFAGPVGGAALGGYAGYQGMKLGGEIGDALGDWVSSSFSKAVQAFGGDKHKAALKVAQDAKSQVKSQEEYQAVMDRLKKVGMTK